MKLFKDEEKDYRKKEGLEEIGKYDAVNFGMGNLLFEEVSDALAPREYLDKLSLIRRGVKHAVFDGIKDGKRILNVTTPAGSSAASMFFERYLCHGYAVRGVGIGYMGATQKDLRIGDIVIPDEAIVGEGTTSYYFPKNSKFPPTLKKGYKAKPSRKILDRLVEEAKKEKIDFRLGPIYTTDSFVMETPRMIKNLSESGALGLDMETSALFSIADFHDKDAAAILVVTDNQLTNHSHCLENFYRGRETACVKLQKAIKIATNALIK
jgi:purine-nucleoside phosphorylase